MPNIESEIVEQILREEYVRLGNEEVDLEVRTEGIQYQLFSQSLADAVQIETLSKQRQEVETITGLIEGITGLSFRIGRNSEDPGK